MLLAVIMHVFSQSYLKSLLDIGTSNGSIFLQSYEALVSIISPIYNKGRFLSRYLDSVLSQTYTAIELILVNDGSTDCSEQIVESYVPILEKRQISVKYIKKKNEGVGAALNTGLQVFTGQFIVWPDSDDFMDEILVEKMVMFLKNNKKYGLVRVNVNIWYERRGKLRKKCTIAGNNKNRFKDDLFDALVFGKPGGWVLCGSYMVRAEVFIKTHPLKSIYPSRGGQNLQMLLPVVYQSKCGYIDESLHNYVIRKGSHSHSFYSARDFLKRLDVMEDIYLNTFKMIAGLDRIKYAKLIRNRYKFMRLSMVKKKLRSKKKKRRRNGKRKRK